MKLVKTQASTLLLAAISALTASPAAYALKFTIADTEISVENLLTAGALMRMQGSDSTLISKSNINPGICVRRTSPDPYDADNRTYAGNTCNPGEMTGAENANDFYIRQPGAFSPNGDNGNLNFEKYDIVSANTKLTSDISFEIADFKFFTRTTGYFDAKYSHLNEQHPDTTAQLSDTNYPSLSRELSGVRAKFLDYFVSRKFEIADRNFNLKVGNQVLNWGESSFLL